MKQLKGDAWEFINRIKHRRCISSVVMGAPSRKKSPIHLNT